MNPIDTVVIVAACAAGFSVLRRSVRTKRSMLPTGVLLWAAACILQTSSVYDRVDPLLGGANITNLVYRSLAVVALGCLTVMVLRANHGLRVNLRQETLVAAVTVIVGLVQGAVFFANAWPENDTYLARYAGQLGREAFWSILLLAVGAFSVLVLVTAGREWRSHSIRSTRWGLGLIGLAALLDLAWMVEGLAISILQLTRGSRLFRGDQPDPVASGLLLGMVVCTGLGIAVASAEGFVERTWMRLLLIRITPPWRRVVRLAPELTLPPGTAGRHALGQVDVEDVLYRRWVEMLDCERAGVYVPNRRDRLLLETIAATFTGEPPSDRQKLSRGLSALLGIGAPA